MDNNIKENTSYCPKVSIIVPCYNAERFLSECIESILNQSFDDFEVIISDNGSTDGSCKIVSTIGDSRVRIVDSSAKKGASFARNVGIQAARGKYIMFVDSDDWVEPVMLQEALDFVISQNLDWALGGLCKERGESHEYYMDSASCKKYIYEGDKVRYLLYKTIGYKTFEAPEIDPYFASGPVCKIMRAELAQNTLFQEDLTIGEDTVFNVGVLAKVKRAGVVGSLWYHYRINQDSLIQSYTINEEPAVKRMLVALRYKVGAEDSRALYYWKVRAMKQLHALLMRAKNSEVSDLFHECVNDAFWLEAASGFSLARAPLEKRVKFLAFAMRHNNIALRRLLLSSYGMKPRSGQ